LKRQGDAQKDIPTQEAQASQKARFSRPSVQRQRAESAQAAAQQGAQTPVGEDERAREEDQLEGLSDPTKLEVAHIFA
jgi:hypothetical protein